MSSSAKVAALVGLSWFLFFATAASAQPVVTLCSGEEPQALSEEMRILEEHLSGIRLELRDCEANQTSSSPQTFFASFASDQHGRVILSLDSASSQRRTRVIPWLEDTDAPISQTASKQRLASLALFIETLIAELDPVLLTRAPDVASLGGPPDAEPPEPAPPVTPVDSEPTKIRWSASALGGATAMLKDTWAPSLAISASMLWDRFGFWLAAGGELDSNFAIEGRPFETRQLQILAGLELLVFQNRLISFSGRTGIVWQSSFFKRADIANADWRRWSDLGGAVHAVFRVYLLGPVGVCLLTGVEFYPSPRRARIKGGPERRVNSATFPLLAGVFASF